MLDTTEELPEDDVNFHSGQVCAKAEVPAEPERELVAAFTLRTSSFDASVKTVSSRLAEANESNKWSPGSNVTPPTLKDCWQVRMKCFTGET